jgi:cytochrome b561
MKIAAKYHPVLVTLHWLLAILIIGALGLGFFVLAPMSNSDPVKLDILMWHMAGGMLILALMLIRFVVRLATAKPPAATIGSPRLDRLAPLTHYGFYLLIVLLVGTGYATAILAHLPDIVFARSGEALPATFMIYPPRPAHGLLAFLLVCLITLHMLAALYHQFGRKDGLLRRMWYGRRTAD